MEKRTATEIRAAGRKLTGTVATFNNEARISDFSESIAPGAFASSLQSNPDILALVDHDGSRVLARTKSGTLQLTEDEHGLHFSIDVPNTSLGNDIIALATRGDLGGMSFGFHVPAGGDSWQGDKRTLKSIDLREISVVQSFPAYDGTSVQARSRQQRSDVDRRIALIEMEGAINVAV